MQTTEHFINAHRAKLTWKMLRHGVGVALGTQKREGIGPMSEDMDIDYIETIYD